jgi:hypothetical protein
MTDADLVRKKLAFIETCVADLRRLAEPARIEQDIREERFVEHYLDDLLGYVAAVRARLGEASDD